MPIRLRVPPGAVARAHHLLGSAPAEEILRPREHDLALRPAELGLGAVEQNPLAADPVRQQRSVLVLGLADDAVALDGLEILVVARKTAGPAGPYAVQVIDPAVELGDVDDPWVLEAPQLALDSFVGAEERLRIDAQPSQPFAERATVRCEMPREVLDAGEQDGSPSTTRAAGLKTALTGYGQSAAVRIGFAGWRVNSSRLAHAGTDSRGSGDDGQPERRPCRAAAQRGGRRASIRPPRCRSSSRRRGRRCSPRREVVERPLQLVATEEPVERLLRAHAVLGVARHGERGELRLDERRGVERLLVAVPGAGSERRGRRAPSAEACPPPGRTRRRASEARRAPSRRQLVRAERRPADDQRVRETGVVVA